MDEKKVREAIYCMKSFVDETVCEECDYYETCDHTRAEENAKIAIEALEKQLPKKVDAKENFRDFYGRLIYYKGFCPNCGFVVDSSKNNHCNACGQKLDWKEAEEEVV